MELFARSEKTRVVEEIGGVARLGELVRELGGRRVLLVTDPGIVAAGHVERGEAALRAAGLVVERFADVHENPTTADVARGLAVARDFGPDLLVGFGGGSPIDVAKGVNFRVSCGGEMSDYRGRATATASLLPLVAVPTTAGTGTEVQSFALIADAATHQKMACGDPSAAPKIALLDAELTLTLPPFVTACTGLDAIGHAVESAVTKPRTTVSAHYARAAFEVLAANFPRVVDVPTDLAARAGMLRGAALAGLAIEHSMLGAAHSLANPLTVRHALPHGQAVGTMLPYVVRFNATLEPATRQTYAALARSGGFADAHAPDEQATEALATVLIRFLRLAGLPVDLKPLGLDERALRALAGEAAEQWTAQFNPTPVDPSAFERLLNSAS